ncbi:MAG: WD40 repeat domain-containing protein [Actinomycetota bacterium]|nr:WD40 repeat domain-containing protein [Actinomycetota bacterium]
MSNRRLDDLLRKGRLPGEDEARDRTWHVVREAHAEREPISWPRKHARPLALAAGVAVLVAGALSPPGMAVFGSLRKAVGTERVKRSVPAIEYLPGGGELLVSSSSGTWVVYPNGSRRRLGSYADASFSPHALYVAGTRGHELVTFEPNRSRAVHWAISRAAPVSRPVWGPDGYRIAYFAGRSLRVIVGDGSEEAVIAPAATLVKPAWQPLPIVEPKGSRHVLAFVGPRGGIGVVDTDKRRRLWRAPAGDGVRALTWSADGKRLLVVGRRGIRVYGPTGRLLLNHPTKGATLSAAFAPRSHSFAFVVAHPRRGESIVLRGDADRFRPVQAFGGPGRISDLAWSPSGAWLLLAWKSADQWIFIRSAPVRKPVIISEVTRQFPAAMGPGSYPSLQAWCCSS